MADPTSPETLDTLPTSEVLPSGGIVTRTDGTQPAPAAPTDWRASLSPDLQQEPTLAKYKSLDEALKGSVHAQKMVGDAVRVPKPDAPAAEWAAFHTKLGVPETPDKYALDLPALPEGLSWQQEQLAGFKTVAHQAGITPRQAQALLGWYTGYSLKLREASVGTEARDAQAERAASVAALEGKWGPYQGPMWQHYQGRAEQAIRTLMGDAPPEAVQRIVDSANEPEVADAFARLADSLLERGFIGVDEMPSGLGAESAQQKADEIRDAAAKDPRHPLMDEHHPDHARVLKQFLDYQAVAAGPEGRRLVTEVRR